MKRIIGTVSLSATALLGSQTALAGPPLPTPDEVNILILMDVSGSMSEPMTYDPTSNRTKFDVALQEARDYVIQHWGDPDVEFALWAFDSSYPGYYRVLRAFPSTGFEVLDDLGADGSVHPDLYPQSATPLAAAACAAAGAIAASLDENGALLQPGYEWGKMEGGRRLRIERRIFIGTDGLENATPDTHECGGPTSSGTYDTYEPESWQAKVRNKLLSGNPNRHIPADHGLVVDVRLIFEDYLSGLSSGSESGYSASSVSYSTEPTLRQALEFYSGMATETSGSFETVTLRADGNVDSRHPGDVDYSGCVDEDDYDKLLEWYGWPVTPMYKESYWADLNGDGWVDDLDYLMLAEHWYEGSTC